MDIVTKSYLKVIGIRTGIFKDAEVVDEVHRETVVDCADYIKEHHHDNQTIWLILPQ